MLFFGRKDTLLSVTPAQQNEAITKLIEATTLRRGYYLLLVLSVMIITGGLLMDNQAIIIGGMVIAPLLLPILALSLSLVGRSTRGILHSLGVLSLSIFATVIVSHAMAQAAAITNMTLTWFPESYSPALYFIVAFCSGIVAAFAWVKEDIAPTIAGIAIAVSLLPPLCGVGIATAQFNGPLTMKLMEIFALNVIGILLAAILVFIILGFFRAGKTTERIVKQATAEE